MNPNQINAAIAEALGWKPIHRGWMCSKDGGKSAWLFGDDKWELQKAVRDLSESDSRFGSEVIQDFYPPPDYTSDLNAMAAAVGSLACHDHRGTSPGTCNKLSAALPRLTRTRMTSGATTQQPHREPRLSSAH